MNYPIDLINLRNQSPLTIGWLILFLLMSWGCKKNDSANLPTPKEEFKGFYKPNHFPDIQQPFDVSKINESSFLLGKRLFYDPILSRDSTVSCGSCHIQFSAFTQHGHDVSHGIDDLLGRRNSLPIQNLMWQKNYLWDGGILNLELVAINAITSPVEMDENLPHVVEKLKRNKIYPKMFKDAFGSEEITSTKMLVALGHFIALFISDQSKYDDVMNGKAQFTEQEQRGYNLFKQHCSSCHKEPLFTDETFRNNGIQQFFTIDKGRYEISLMEGDEGKFKVPSLRNVELSAPYMHDGRFKTLQEVLNHYSSGIINYPNLDPLLVNKIPLNSQEKEDILSFLKTLTDRSFIQEKRFSEF